MDRDSHPAYNGRQTGRTGAFRSGMCASSGVRSAFRLLHSRQARTQFSQVLAPPRERGSTWSIVRSSLLGWIRGEEQEKRLGLAQTASSENPNQKQFGEIASIWHFLNRSCN